MEQTYAELLEQKGEIRGKQQTLIRLLQKKFEKKVSARIAKVIERTQSIDQLEAWLDNVISAKTLDDVGLEPRT